MRPPSNSTLRNTLEALERSERHEVWLDADDFAGLVQRLQGVNRLPYEWTKGVLALGILSLEGYGFVRRYEEGRAPAGTLTWDEAPVDVSRLALAEGSPE